MRRKGKQQPAEPSWVTVVTMAKALYSRTGESEMDHFARMVIAANADGGPSELVGGVVPTETTLEVAQREPHPGEAAASRIVALVSAFAGAELTQDAANELMIYAVLFAARFEEYERASAS
jgi:hypothetical protein